MTINVSSGGFCTRLLRVLPVDERIEGTIHVDGRDEPFVGRVAWVRPGNPRMNLMGEMGIRFEVTSPAIARAIAGPEPGPGRGGGRDGG